jgi:hypothetical protein
MIPGATWVARKLGFVPARQGKVPILTFNGSAVRHDPGRPLGMSLIDSDPELVQETALSFMDPDLHGFFIVQVREVPGGADITVQTNVPGPLWPGVVASVGHFMRDVEGVR